jgi:hypothetical protein
VVLIVSWSWLVCYGQLVVRLYLVKQVTRHYSSSLLQAYPSPVNSFFLMCPLTSTYFAVSEDGLAGAEDSHSKEI